MATDLTGGVKGLRRALALGLVLAAVLTACARGSPAETGEEERLSRPLLPENRLELPEFDLPRFRALLMELRGTPVVVNIWGSWCAPCRVEAPDLAKVSREFEGRAQFVGVDILDTREDARVFILEFDWPYPSVFDPKGEIRDRLGYIGQPVTIVYDREGRKNFEWVGALNAEILRREIRKVL